MKVALLAGKIGVSIKYNLVFVISTLVTLFILFRAIYFAPRGFDLTDESYYLMWMTDPWAYKLEGRLFGFFYHPLYLLVGGDITYLRLANLLVTWLLFYGLALTLIKKIELHSVSSWSLGKTHRYLAALLLTTPVQLLANFVCLPATPSYNSLCAQGLAIALWGLLLIDHKCQVFAFSSWVILGLGGYMTFMGKFSSAMLLTIGVTLYLLASHRNQLPYFFLAVVVALTALVVSAVTVNGSIGSFIYEYKLGLQWVSVEGSPQRYQLWLKFFKGPSLKGWQWLVFFAVVSLSYAYVKCYISSQRKYDLLCELFLMTILTLGIGVTSGFLPFPSQLFHYARIHYGLFGFGLLAAPIGALLACWPQNWKHHFRDSQVSLLKFALLLVIMPHIFAFGTGHPYFFQASAVAVFWLMGAVTLLAALGPDRDKTVAAFKIMATASLLIMCCFTRYSEEYPYRQSQHLLQQRQIITAPDTGHVFIVTDDIHDYLVALQKIATAAGFKKGQCLIDITGHSPGVAYFLGAKAPGAPWLVGGYGEASKLWLTLLFDRLPPSDLEGCWVLLEPQGPRPNDPVWLTQYGLYVEDMTEVGAIMAPYAGRIYRQILLKPK